MNETPLFERIGGAPTIEHLVDNFYDRMESEDHARKVRAMHSRDLSRSRHVLKQYLSEWLGGPKLYSPEHGHPRMRMRHMRAPIDSAARDAWLTCMQGALNDTVADSQARDAIYDAMARLADWMRNTEDPVAAGSAP